MPWHSFGAFILTYVLQVSLVYGLMSDKNLGKCSMIITSDISVFLFVLILLCVKFTCCIVILQYFGVLFFYFVFLFPSTLPPFHLLLPAPFSPKNKLCVN